MRAWPMAIAVLLTVHAGRSGDEEPPRPPGRLSETGLYAAGSTTVDPSNRPYAPQYALWTDGAAKSRWIHLPPGATIDAHDDTAWRFPVGTKLWKEFAFGGNKVETRLLWKAGEDRWVFAAYVWNDEQTDAVLAPEEGVAHAASLAEGKHHSVPSVEDCRSCHEGGATRVLGFSALQLSDDRDPGAPHAEPLRAGMVTNRTLVEEGRLTPDRRDLVEHPPAIRGSNPVERSALGYLSANCGHCHNPVGPLAALGLVLSHEPAVDRVEPALLTTRDRVGHWFVPGAPRGDSHIVSPGSPETSALFYRMKSRRPSSAMPPLGTVLADAEALALIEAWINGTGTF